jgi:hypothetical protein
VTDITQSRKCLRLLFSDNKDPGLWKKRRRGDEIKE